MAVQVVEGVLALIGLALVADVTGKVIYGLRRRRRMMAEWVAAGGPLRRLVANDWWRPPTEAADLAHSEQRADLSVFHPWFGKSQAEVSRLSNLAQRTVQPLGPKT